MSLPLEPIPMPTGDGDDGASGRPPRIPCDEFEPMLGHHLDRELTRAEEVRLDAHLDECAKCRARLGHLEAMSDALKAWDVETNNAIPAENRIQRAVLSRVAETSHRRRIDDRVLRIVQFAAAACVLLALGLGLTFGLMWERPVDISVATTDGHLPFSIGPDDLFDIDLPHGRPMSSLPSMDIERDLERLRGTARAPVEFEPAAGRALDLAQVARLDVERRRIEQEAELHGSIGERGVSVALPGQGEARFLSKSAWLYAESHGWFERWTAPRSGTVDLAGPDEPGVSRTDPEVAEAAPFGLVLRDVLSPMPGLNGVPADGLLSAPTLDAWTGWVPGEARTKQRILARAIPRPEGQAPLELRSADGTVRTLETIDPLVAQREGWLRFEESGVDRQTVVAFVKGNAKPILIPAGHIMTSGVTDRVVAEPVVLPASPDHETREPVPCRVVRLGPDRDDSTSPRLTRWIAGPTIRALLGQGASDDALLTAAEAQATASQGAFTPSWTLLQAYETKGVRGVVTAQMSRLEWRQPQSGFVVTDGLKRVLGVEFLRIDGAAGAELAKRLYIGYVVEAASRVNGAGDHLGSGQLDLATALELFQAADAQLVSSRGSVEGEIPSQRLSSLSLEDAGMVFQSLELDGQPALVSGLPTPAR